MNLKNMSYREIKIAAKILNDIADNGCPDNLDDDSFDISFNPDSGFVYAHDDDFNVFILNSKGTLQQWFTCPICCHEGFIQDMQHNSDDIRCQDFLRDIGYYNI